MAVIPNIAMSDTDHTIPKSICLKLSKSISCKPIKSAALPAQPLQLKPSTSPSVIYTAPGFFIRNLFIKAVLSSCSGCRDISTNHLAHKIYETDTPKIMRKKITGKLS